MECSARRKFCGLFAGAGRLAIAASKAGFEHDAVVEYNHAGC